MESAPSVSDRRSSAGSSSTRKGAHAAVLSSDAHEPSIPESHDAGAEQSARVVKGPGDQGFTQPAQANSDADATGRVRDTPQRLERLGERTEDFVDTMELAIGRAVPKKVHRGGDPRQNTVVNIVWRAVVLLVGLALICVGILLLVLPGPGWGAIILGLVVLATEYTWANRLLVPIRRRATQEMARVRRLSRRQQLALLAAVAVSAVALWVIASHYVPHWPMPW